jgi:hypothetical protein
MQDRQGKRFLGRAQGQTEESDSGLFLFRILYSPIGILEFVRKVHDESLLQGSSRLAGPQPVTRIFFGTTALPEIPPCPPLLKGGWGDFRGGPPKGDFLAIFKIFHFARPCAESRTFRTKLNFKWLFLS